ncbi:GntR family transcriptional regulator [Arthrobacter sp. Sr24]
MKPRSSPHAVSRQVLADHVYDDILESLMDGRLMPGDSVSIDGTARDLEVSPTPVREALARLEHTGLVQRVALKGYRVAPLSSSAEMAQLMEARLVIEPVNTRLAGETMTEQTLSALAQSIHDLETAPRGPSFAEFRDYFDADERFHRLIAENAGNPFLLAAYNALGGQVQRFRLFSGVGITDASHAIAEHRAVFEALQAGDPVRAAEKMTEHVSNVRARAMADAPEA